MSDPVGSDPDWVPETSVCPRPCWTLAGIAKPGRKSPENLKGLSAPTVSGDEKPPNGQPEHEEPACPHDAVDRAIGQTFARLLERRRRENVTISFLVRRLILENGKRETC